MAIEWNDDLSVGVKEIDEQHQEFIKILNHLFGLIYALKDRAELDAVLNILASYAKKHFDTEERYFDEYDYEFSDEHKQEHRKLIQQVTDFQSKFKAGEEEITTELADFLENWLVEHLGSQDKKYIKCFHEHGLS